MNLGLIQKTEAGAVLSMCDPKNNQDSAQPGRLFYVIQMHCIDNIL